MNSKNKKSWPDAEKDHRKKVNHDVKNLVLILSLVAVFACSIRITIEPLNTVQHGIKQIRDSISNSNGGDTIRLLPLRHRRTNRRNN